MRHVDKRVREHEVNEGRLFIGKCPSGMANARRKLLEEYDDICKSFGVPPKHRQMFLRHARKEWRQSYDRKAHGHNRVVNFLERVHQQRRAEDKARGYD